MEETGRSEALALWNDVVDLMARRQVAAPLVAMLKTCNPVSFDGAHLVVETGARFMKMQIEHNAALIEQSLQEIAFVPLELVVNIASGGAASVSTSSVMTQKQVDDVVRTTTSPVSSEQMAAYQDKLGAREDIERVTEKIEPTEESAARARRAPGSKLLIDTGSVVSPDVVSKHLAVAQPGRNSNEMVSKVEGPQSFEERFAANPLVSHVTEADSKLTFDRFVQGDENEIALLSAKQVADGNLNYNPLFIYGKSGLGKTHLLKAIQNYILENHIEKICVYRVAHDFVADYVTAMQDSKAGAKDAFTRSYRDVDVLIIDDIQFLKGASTVGFFFDLFNYLKDHGKQIVLAADESPRELGLGNQDFNERMISRLDMGVACPIQVPNYELKLALIANFYSNMKKDAARNHIPGYEGELSAENLSLMADHAGTNIRVIESFCQQCLMEATKKQAKGRVFSDDDIIAAATQKFGVAAHTISIEGIMSVVEEEFDVGHEALIGNSRKKENMVPRKLCLYLARDLTDMTLVDIGKCFSNRTHATVYKSVEDIKKMISDDYLFGERVNKIKERIVNS